jgi:hypothetical protein
MTTITATLIGILASLAVALEATGDDPSWNWPAPGSVDTRLS